jgi:hypothetical protein
MDFAKYMTKIYVPESALELYKKSLGKLKQPPALQKGKPLNATSGNILPVI